MLLYHRQISPAQSVLSCAAASRVAVAADAIMVETSTTARLLIYRTQDDPAAAVPAWMLCAGEPSDPEVGHRLQPRLWPAEYQVRRR
jgi:hypothetical protein